jgi:hypothetical protein
MWINAKVNIEEFSANPIRKGFFSNFLFIIHNMPAGYPQ